MSTLSEVARTGRKFRRKSEPDQWYYLSGKSVLAARGDNDDDRVWMPDAEQLTSTDWEASPKKLEITAQDLLEVAKVMSNNPITHQRRLAPAEFMKLVIEELGLHE